METKLRELVIVLSGIDRFGDDGDDAKCDKEEEDADNEEEEAADDEGALERIWEEEGLCGTEFIAAAVVVTG